MASCPKCGSVISEGASYCSICGSPVSSVNNPPPTSPGATSAGVSSNIAGALTYLLGFVTGIIFLVIEPYSKDRFVRFHAFQSIFFCVVLIVFRIIWGGIFLGLFAFGFFWWIFYAIANLVYLAFFLLWLFLMYKAYNNETYKIPVIGDLASRQAAK